MIDILKIALVFTAILILLRLKWNVGYVLLVASGLLAVLYLMPLSRIGLTIRATVIDPVTIKLFLALTLIRILEMILREREVLARMMDASRKILRSKKAVIISMPMLIGLLPSLGGAYFSAPMVEESSKGLKMSAEEKGFVNYWYRHPWEYVLPLYPGVILASALTNIHLRSLILANATYSVVVFVTGFFFCMRKVKGSFKTSPELRVESLESKAAGRKETAHGRPFWSFLPLIFVLVLVIVLHMELHSALALTIAGLFVFYRYSLRDIFKTLKYGFTKDVIVLIFGVMLFKFAMDNSGAVVHLSQYFTEKSIPLLPVLIALPFVSGLLTGVTVGFVGSTFPLIVSIAGGAHLNQISLAFAAGFLGVLLSPVHLCLVLTREYFKADMWGIYKRIIPASGIVMASAFVVYFML